MKNIKSKRKYLWVKIKQGVREFFFKLFALRKITNTISNRYYALLLQTNIEYTAIFMVPSDFKKYSDKQIEHAFDILVKNKKLASWSKKRQDDEDGYLLILLTENRSECRILKSIPQEIDLKQVNLQQISLQPTQTPAELSTQKENPTSADITSEKTSEDEKPTQTPTNNNTKTEAIKDDEDYSKPF